MRVASLYICVLGLLAGAAHAAMPEQLNYQGRLLNSTGQPVPDSTGNTVVFRIYTVPSAGADIWNETRTGVTTTAGLFNVVLGEVAPLSLLFNADYWIGISVNGDPEMAPRQKLTAAPYAFRAKYADNAGVAAPLSLTHTGNQSTLSIYNSNGGNFANGINVEVNGLARPINAVQTGTGIGIYGEAVQQPAIYGVNVGSGFAVHGYAFNGAGVRAESNGSGPGLHASSVSGPSILLGGLSSIDSQSNTITMSKYVSFTAGTNLSSSVPNPLFLGNSLAGDVLTVSNSGAGAAVFAVNPSLGGGNAFSAEAYGNGSSAISAWGRGNSRFAIFAESTATAPQGAVFGNVGGNVNTMYQGQTAGLVGLSNVGHGVIAQSESGIGLVARGQATAVSATASNGTGLFVNSLGGGSAVLAYNNHPNVTLYSTNQGTGAAIRGQANGANYGVIGASGGMGFPSPPQGSGVIGASSNGGGYGVVAYNTAASGIALSATALGGGGIGAVIQGERGILATATQVGLSVTATNSGMGMANYIGAFSSTPTINLWGLQVHAVAPAAATYAEGIRVTASGTGSATRGLYAEAINPNGEGLIGRGLGAGVVADNPGSGPSLRLDGSGKISATSGTITMSSFVSFTAGTNLAAGGVSAPLSLSLTSAFSAPLYVSQGGSAVALSVTASNTAILATARGDGNVNQAAIRGVANSPFSYNMIGVQGDANAASASSAGVLGRFGDTFIHGNWGGPAGVVGINAQAGGVGIYAGATQTASKALVVEGGPIGISVTAKGASSYPIWARANNGTTVIEAIQDGGSDAVRATANSGIAVNASSNSLFGYAVYASNPAGRGGAFHGGTVALSAVADAMGATAVVAVAMDGNAIYGRNDGPGGFKSSILGVARNTNHAVRGVHLTGSGEGSLGGSLVGMQGVGVHGRSGPGTFDRGVFGESASGYGVFGQGVTGLAGSVFAADQLGVLAENSGGGLALKVVGQAEISGLRYPAADGSAGQLLATDGSGLLSFVPAGGVSAPLALTAASSPVLFVNYSGAAGNAIEGRGTSAGTAATAAIVRGHNSGNGPGVWGRANSVAGVVGDVAANPNSVGVYGAPSAAASAGQNIGNVSAGVMGYNSAAGGVGVWARAAAPATRALVADGPDFGVSATASAAGGVAGYFQGPTGLVASGTSLGISATVQGNNTAVYQRSSGTQPTLFSQNDGGGAGAWLESSGGNALYGRSTGGSATIYGRNEGGAGYGGYFESTAGPASLFAGGPGGGSIGMISQGTAFGLSATATGASGVGGRFSATTGLAASGSSTGVSATSSGAAGTAAYAANSSATLAGGGAALSLDGMLRLVPHPATDTQAGANGCPAAFGHNFPNGTITLQNARSSVCTGPWRINNNLVGATATVLVTFLGTPPPGGYFVTVPAAGSFDISFPGAGYLIPANSRFSYVVINQ